jgi:hypothetical protein
MGLPLGTLVERAEPGMYRVSTFPYWLSLSTIAVRRAYPRNPRRPLSEPHPRRAGAGSAELLTSQWSLPRTPHHGRR